MKDSIGKIRRFVTLYNAFLDSEDYSSEITIKMKLRNPDDNFDRANIYVSKDGQSFAKDESDKAFKVKTFTFDLLELSKLDSDKVPDQLKQLAGEIDEIAQK